MRYNEKKTIEFIRHKVDIILNNGPLDELDSDPAICFYRLMDIFCVEGPRDRSEVSGYRVVTEMVRRGAATMAENKRGVSLRMPHTEWLLRYVSGHPRELWMIVPEREWDYPFAEPYNIGQLIAVDRFMPELVHQADILSMQIRIRRAEKEATTPDSPS